MVAFVAAVGVVTIVGTITVGAVVVVIAIKTAWILSSIFYPAVAVVSSKVP